MISILKVQSVESCLWTATLSLPVVLVMASASALLTRAESAVAEMQATAWRSAMS